MKYNNIIDNFSRLKVLVIGDIMLDKYILGSVERISPEAPIPVVNVAEERCVLGGAANTANNISTLGAKAHIIGVVGNDNAKEILFRLLDDSGIIRSGIVISNKLRTIQKIRIVAKSQQLARLDYEDKDIFLEDELCQSIERAIKNVDIVILSDYAKGVITKKTIERIKTACVKENKKIIIDPKPTNKIFYKDAFLIKPNMKESEEICKIKIKDEQSIIQAGKIMLKTFNSNILMTLGEQGMALFDKNSFDKKSSELKDKDAYDNNSTPSNTGYSIIPSLAKEVYDVSGAGDTCVAVLSLCIASGASLVESAEIANHAAGIVVAKSGTATLSCDELKSALNIEAGKLKNSNDIAVIAKRMHDNKKKIVFTNGCFDILHSGHIHLIRKAKSLGDVLIVGLNSDSSIKRLKGRDRPILDMEERIEIISSLECVDYVVVFDEDNPCNIISLIKPDIHVKGGDYSLLKSDSKSNSSAPIKSMPEAEIIRSYGGKIVIVESIEGKSTTGIIERIKNSE